MFSQQQLSSLSRNYFDVIIIADSYDVTLRTKNTGHYWYLHNTGVLLCKKYGREFLMKVFMEVN